MISKLAIVLLIFLTLIVFGLPLVIVAGSGFFLTTGIDLIYLLGKYFALAAFLVLTLQYVWTAKFRFLESLVSYDQRVAIHRTLGFLSILVLSLHPIMILGTYAIWQIPLVLTPPIALGFAAFLILLMIAGSTFLGRIWGVRYETWKKLHWLNFAVLTVAFIHSLRIGSDLYGWRRIFWIALWGVHLLTLLSKLWHKVRVLRPTYEILETKRLGNNVVGLNVERANQRYHPGQFAFLSAQFGNRWESWHPFSLTSSGEQTRLSFAIKGLGDFSSQVARLKAGERVKVDGPYGGFSTHIFRDKRYIMIAAGVGISPIYGILRDLRQNVDAPEVYLIYCNHHESDILFREDLDSWFEKRKNWHITYILSSQPDWPGAKGRLAPEQISSFCNNDLSGTIFLCGPLAMVRSIRRYLIAQGIPRKKIRREQFVFLP